MDPRMLRSWPSQKIRPILARSVPILLLRIGLVGSLSLGAFESARSEFFWGNPSPQGNPIRAIELQDDFIGYAVGDLGTSLRTIDGGATWEDRTRLGEFTADLRDLIFDGEGALLAAGSEPGIFRSTDEGTTWQPVAVEPPASFYNLFRIDSATISSVGAGGQVYRSLDDGASWTQMPALGGQELVDQWWHDAQRGYVIGPLRARATTNGGMSWQSIPGVVENFFFPGDIQFLDANNGWILVDFTTYRTTNGGASWFPKHGNPGVAPIYQQEAVLVDVSTRWICTAAEGAEIWKTTDDGLTWTQQYGNQTVSGIHELTRAPSGRLDAVSDAGDLLWSDDGGSSWLNATLALTQSRALLVVESNDRGTCFAGGYDGGWIQSTDFGRTWFLPALGMPFTHFFAIASSGSTWYAGGTSSPSRVARSSDDGATWQAVTLPGGSVGAAVSFAAPSAVVAFAATYGGSTINYVFRTTDGGASWHLRNSGLPTNQRFFCISFLDPLHGYVGGGETQPSLWHTTDGGASWISRSPSGFLGADEPHDMHWIDLDTGVAVGVNGAYRTTDGGAHWSVTHTGPYQRLDFDTPLHGYSRDLDQSVWETEDGGISWHSIYTPISYYYDDVEAIPSGYLVAGTYGRILGSVSNASTVEPARSSLSVSLTAGPNPARAAVRLFLRSPIEDHLEIRVVDVQGRAHAHWSRSLGRGESVEISWDPPASGVWFVQARGASGARAATRFIRLAGR